MSDHVLTDTLFENFDLHPLLVQGLADSGFTRCTPIQALTLPVALAGRDVAGQAQTGTGKTCAFLVAVMNHLLTRPARAARKDNDPRALVIAPTRELAIQIDKDARAIGAQTGLKTALIYGGVDYDKQRQMLREGCDIVIATPGRMLDYYKQHVFRLDNVEVMVVDEADRMFDLGFIKDVRYIFRRLPPRDERQVLMYSATLSHRVLELAYEHMHEAEKLVAETDTITADHVRQVVYFPAKEEKLPLLLNLLAREKPERALVFVNTRAQTERVRDWLKRHGYRVGGLSGDVPQVKRQKLLQRFKDGQLDMLVCTDVAARGLHIPHVSHVFNYDLPQDAEDYVHRIGRTARLGAEGDAISFACDLYAMSLPDIEDYIEQKLPVGTIEPEWLVMPKAPPASATDKPAATTGEGTSPTPRKPRRRRRGGRHRGGHGEGNHATAGKPANHTQTAFSRDASSSHADAPAPASNEDAARRPSTRTAGDQSPAAPRKRRRRRGGRNHRGGRGGQAGQGRAARPASNGQGRQAQDPSQRRNPSSRDSHDDRQRSPDRPNQGGNPAQPRKPRAAPKPSPQAARRKPTQVQATPAGVAGKRGFLRRLTDGLFGGGN